LARIASLTALLIFSRNIVFCPLAAYAGTPDLGRSRS
jgi:hypothetical protein